VPWRGRVTPHTTSNTAGCPAPASPAISPGRAVRLTSSSWCRTLTCSKARLPAALHARRTGCLPGVVGGFPLVRLLIAEHGAHDDGDGQRGTVGGCHDHGAVPQDRTSSDRLSTSSRMWDMKTTPRSARASLLRARPWSPAPGSRSRPSPVHACPAPGSVARDRAPILATISYYNLGYDKGR
jgi:hypothetical protein